MDATTEDVARSLWVIYLQMPTAVRDEFRKLLEREKDNADGLNGPIKKGLQED